MERVEVIRGPQSTLFGRNTPAGVVSFITQQPEFEFGATGELTIGNYGQTVVGATVTGPLNEAETLAFRVDATSHSNSGYLDNVAPNSQVSELNNRDRQNFRGQLLWLPDDNTEVRIIGDYGIIDENCCAAPFGFYDPIDQGALIALGGTALPADPFSGRMAVDGLVNTALDTSGISAEVNRDFDGFTFTSITAYRRYDESQNIDADFSDLSLVQPRSIDNEYNSFTQEFRLTSTGDNFMDWMGGVFFYNNDLEFDQNLGYGVDAKPFFDLASRGAVAPIVAAVNGAAPGTLPANAGGISVLEFLVGANNLLRNPNVAALPARGYVSPGLTVQENFQYDTTSWSTFGQLDFNLTDRFTLSLGGRYTQEEKDMVTDITISDPISALNFAQLGSELRFPACANPAILATCPYAVTAILAGQAAGGDPAAGAALGQIANAVGLAPNNPLLLVNPTAAALIANSPANFLNGFAAFQNFSPVSANQFPTSRSDDNFSYSIIGAYDVSDTLNIYASYSTGFKPGGFNLSYEAAETGVFEFQEENASSWEIGAKGSLLDGSMLFALTYFNQEIEDFQAENFVGSGFALDNAGSIEVSGLEFDFTWAATERLLFTFGGSYLFESIYGDYEFAPCPDSSPLLGPVYNVSDPLFAACAAPRTNPATGATGTFNNLTGVDRGNSEFLATLTGNYTHPIGERMELLLRGEASHTSDFALVTGLDPRPVANQDAFTLYNASATLSAVDERWAVQVWGRNITEEDYVKGGFPSVGYLGSSFNVYPGDPRTYGVTLRLRY
jgi:outer membrane receptor protein involved in Fe transport